MSYYLFIIFDSFNFNKLFFEYLIREFILIIKLIIIIIKLIKVKFIINYFLFIVIKCFIIN